MKTPTTITLPEDSTEECQVGDTVTITGKVTSMDGGYQVEVGSVEKSDAEPDGDGDADETGEGESPMDYAARNMTQ